MKSKPHKPADTSVLLNATTWRQFFGLLAGFSLIITIHGQIFLPSFLASAAAIMEKKIEAHALQNHGGSVSRHELVLLLERIDAFERRVAADLLAITKALETAQPKKI